MSVRIVCPPSLSGKASLLKVIWASRYSDVKVKLSRPSSSNSDDSSVPSSSLVQLQLLGDDDDGTGGSMICCPNEENALTLAVATSSSHTEHTSPRNLMLIDEWCEWERTVLRPMLAEIDAKKKSKSVEKALQHLEHALSNSPHLLGHTDSLADIVVVATLSRLIEETTDDVVSVDKLPHKVRMYYTVHGPALAAAKTEAVKRSIALDLDYDPDDVSLYNTLQSVFGTAIRNLFGDGALQNMKHFVDKCKSPKDGDYQCNAAMPVFAALKKSGNTAYKSPVEVAQAIINGVGPDHAVVMDLATQGPGFVLCRVRPSFLEKYVNDLLPTAKLPFPKVPKQVCVVDFSSPNIAKEMHVGHLRSTIIGESVCRILESVGHDVHRINHVGDWGTQFGMLIQYLLEEYPEFAAGGGNAGDLPNITDLTVFYKSAKERFDASPEFKEQSRINVVRLQSGDEQCRKIWKLLCDISRAEFQKVYTRLDVTTEECGESFYNPLIPPVIEEFRKKGLLQSEDGGAQVVFVDDFKVPLMLQKSDGGYGYDSTDAAALKYRLQQLKADRIIIITDFSQGDHFKMIYGAGQKIGWVDESKHKLQHIGFGTVMGEDGKRFKTRSGDTVRLVDLLDEAVSRMESSLTERIKEGKANINVDEVHHVAEAIGYGAVKYFDLRRNPTSNYKFSYDQMLDTKGDTAVYLLYARVRLESIMSKAMADHKIDVQDLLKNVDHAIVLGHDSERNLALSLLVFADTIEQTLDDLYPYHICEYVYKLSNACSDFITQCKVLGSPEMSSRLLLCYLTAQAMDQCFDLLGIRQVKRI